jgi:cation diffusion facilitator CzcD-associated flavoprotein CzcO
MNAKAPNFTSATNDVRSRKVVEMAIVGAGFGGMAMAIRMLQEGNTDFVLIDKGNTVGGTWRENTYPGAACDVQSHMYSFSFEGKTDWSKRYAGWEEIQNYIQDTAKKYQLDQYARFNTEVTAAHYDQETAYWTLTFQDGDTLKCKFFVLASGPLHVPQIPTFKGIENFKGKVFHSAQWDHSYDLSGKNVVSIGTGGSAIQYIPEIAPVVKQLYVMQRTPAWVIPRDERRYLEIEKKIFAKFPSLRRLHRARLYWSNESRVVPIFQPKLMKQGQKLVEAFYRYQVKDPVLAKKLIPNYVLGCKRVLISNKYLPTFNRPNVELVTDGIAEVRENSIVTRDGVERPVDTIIYGTGFITDPRIYMKNFACTGLEGRDLMKDWQDGAESYYGVTTAGYPNMFQLVGPNTGLGHNSIIFMIEAQVHYILEMMKVMHKQKADFVDVRADAQKAFNDQVQKNLEGTVWSSGCTSWYQQDGGKNFALWPGYTWRFWLETRKVKARDYIFGKAKKSVSA